ncbi:ATP-binding protein [Streptomyces sp. NPDC005925]|uniref:ATP-binding protein n=1 Tax=Streptomyces sp. NPDC005925 TaxID=3157172 RepID=UPI0033EB5D80
MAPPSPVGPSRRHPDAGPEPKRRWQFPSHDGSVGVARRQVRDALAQWEAHPGVVDDAILVVSELATNVIAHTDSPLMILTLRLDASRLRIEVEDRCGDSGRPQPGQCRPDDENGRGLMIVAHLAATWGIAASPGTGGSVVWAELPWRRAGAPTGHTERTERDGSSRPVPGTAEPSVSRRTLPGHSVPGRITRPTRAPHAHTPHGESGHVHALYGDATHAHATHAPHADPPHAHAHPPHAHGAANLPPNRVPYGPDARPTSP